MIAISLIAGLVLGQKTLAPADIIRTESVRATMQVLASDELAGRMTLSPGAKRAASYLSGQVKSLGMQPMDGSYLWEFPVTANKRLGKDNRFEIATGAETRELRPGVDYVPLANSQQKTTVSGEAVWMGLGSVGSVRNDYQDIDVKGKIVVVLRGMPAEGPRMSNQAKARAAAEAGAVGIVFVGPMFGGDRDLPATSSSQGLARDSKLVAAGVSQRFAEALCGKKFEELAKDWTPRSLQTKITMRTDLVPDTGKAANVIAVLPGNDPGLRGQYVVIGAHYDHLGYAETGSRTGVEQIHNGADDNASGSAAILEIARYFAKTRTNRRTLIFQWYMGEELGLLGSEAWAKAHPEILARTQVMVNLDMVGRLRDGRMTIYGSETSKEMPSLIDAIQQPGLTIIRDASIPGNSDHFSFTRRNVPAIAPFTGFHDEYHTQNDKIATINMDGIATVARGMVQFIQAADALDTPMLFRPGKKAPPARTNTSGGPRRVRTGFIPDMGGDGKGVLLNGVGAGSPAEKAGVRAGDILIKFGDMKITSLEDLQAALQKAAPGVAVKIVLLRAGNEVELTITPVAADPSL